MKIMKKNNYVKVRDNKNDILFLITNRRNLIKEGKYYDLFDQIFESISKRNYISVFDFLIVGISLVPTSSGFEILRVLRVLRLFRLITAVPQMRKIVSALISVIPGMLSVIALMTLFFYIFAIMATQLFSEKFPEWFGTLGESFYTLFQVMTLESWSMGIVRPVMEVYPYAWVFFVPFIFVVTFVMVNLVVAIIVDAMAILNQEEEQHILEEVHSNETHINEEIKNLRTEIGELKLLMENNFKNKN